jgi:hypothetical protein
MNCYFRTVNDCVSCSTFYAVSSVSGPDPKIPGVTQRKKKGKKKNKKKKAKDGKAIQCSVCMHKSINTYTYVCVY